VDRTSRPRSSPRGSGNARLSAAGGRLCQIWCRRDLRRRLG
jgi:hypothetical protein